MEKEYYEKYWNRQLDDDGIFTLPPAEDNEKYISVIEQDIKGTVLDLGCGEGKLVERLAQYNSTKKVYGVDISQKAIELAKKRNQNNEKTSFLSAPSTTLPFEENTFDLITATDVMEHIVDVSATISEVHRILKPGGKFYITTVDFNLLKKIFIALFKFDEYFYPTTPHIRFFTKKTLTQILHKKGFSINKYLWDGSYLGLMPKGQIVIAEKL